MKHRTALTIPADHPAFAGHFPGAPIVPGVLLLDAVLHAVDPLQSRWQIASAKFLSPLGPGVDAVIEHEVQASGTIRFDILAGGRHIATGSLAAVPSP